MDSERSGPEGGVPNMYCIWNTVADWNMISTCDVYQSIQEEINCKKKLDKPSTTFRNLHTKNYYLKVADP